MYTHTQPHIYTLNPPMQGGTVLLSLCELTPWERWRHYGVRPYKLVLHLLLLLCTTARILHESRRCVVCMRVDVRRRARSIDDRVD